MKALELSNYGVQEMNATDVLCVNGGMDGNEFCLSPELHEKVVKKALKGIKDGCDYVYGFFRGFLGV